MVPLRFASLVLGLLYLLHALRGCSASDHAGSGMLMVVDEVPARRMKLEGRKMLWEEVPRREIEKVEELISGVNSKISGKDANASETAAISQDHLNNKIKNGITLKPNATTEPVHFPSTKPQEYYYLSQDSKEVSAESTRTQQDESRTRFDRAITEIDNLMVRDYNSSNGTRGSAPTNNQEPND